MARTSITEPAILDLLERKHVLSGPEIVELLAEEDFRVNKTSVYRALDRLLEKAEICRLSLGEQTVVYELRNHHHDHAVCNVCGRVLTIECHAQQHPEIPGFQIDHHHATYFGVCSACTK
ncbi:transcriptional repressor [Candidatus Woesebacteria bacterium]|nr:transcriptional repressor [Candidatus Woesebacteria bacterium]MCD8506879.1 transcriptional repressor [Candidatus Woesebacteria bacterium]MCD8527501.1 transcriptional repressor [Candidatus Woesebacteria bacterium]MCD8546242.1 transcriptional repressor [Candidatus Woesebacteria bacterium]